MKEVINMENTLKYAPKLKVVLYSLLALVKGLGNVAIGYISMIMLNDAQYHRGSLRELFLVAACGVAAILGIMLCNFGFSYLKCDITKDVNVYLKNKTMTYLVAQQATSEKEGLSLMTNDLKQIESLKVTNELVIIEEIAAFLLSIIAGLATSWILTLVFIVTSLIPGIIQGLFTKPMQRKGAAWEQENAEYTQSVNDGLNGAATANLYDAQLPVVKRVVIAAKRLENALKSLNFTQGLATEIITAIADIFSFIVPFLVGAVLMFNGQIGAGTLVMIVQLSNNFINPIVNALQQLNEIKSTKPMWDKVELALKSQPAQQNTTVPAFTSIKLSDLSYAIKNRKVFSNLNLSIKPGEKILLMAPSGWGKTTLLKLLLGLIKPDKGTVNISGKDVTGDYSDAHLNFGYINQKPFMFNDTLLFNLTLGRKVTQQKLQKAIAEAGLSELVKEKGLDFEITGNGSNLSGGQIQRVEIARAFLADRPVILADEATSALDDKLSEALHENLLDNSKFTVIEVAHKMTEKERQMFDRIIQLNK